MTIKRHEPSKIYSKVVEANGFVFTAGIVADDIKQDVKGQTQQVLAEIDRVLKVAGTDKSKVVSATIWVTDIRSRDAQPGMLVKIDAAHPGELVVSDRAYDYTVAGVVNDW